MAKSMIWYGRKMFTIWNLMSILGEKQLLGCSPAVLQQLPYLWNTLLPAKCIAGQLRIRIATLPTQMFLFQREKKTWPEPKRYDQMKTSDASMEANKQENDTVTGKSI